MRYATTPTPARSEGRIRGFLLVEPWFPFRSGDSIFPKLPPDAFFALGYQGQMIAILPSRGIVVVRLGMTYDNEWGAADFLSILAGPGDSGSRRSSNQGLLLIPYASADGSWTS